jgi:hypothetical protein
MKKYHYDISIEAKTESEADAKMNALTVLASKLSPKELTGLAHVIQHDPVKTSLAKKYLSV